MMRHGEGAVVLWTVCMVLGAMVWGCCRPAVTPPAFLAFGAPDHGREPVCVDSTKNEHMTIVCDDGSGELTISHDLGNTWAPLNTRAP